MSVPPDLGGGLEEPTEDLNGMHPHESAHGADGHDGVDAGVRAAPGAPRLGELRRAQAAILTEELADTHHHLSAGQLGGPSWGRLVDAASRVWLYSVLRGRSG